MRSLDVCGYVGKAVAATAEEEEDVVVLDGLRSTQDLESVWI